jgi:DNA-binding NarL/FixJ family response regulator
MVRQDADPSPSPQRDPRPARAAEQEETVSASPPRLSPPLVRIGVVDDNTFYRDWLGQAGTLPSHQHVVARAASAQDLASVIHRLPDRRCDVILLDLRIVPGTATDPVHEDLGEGPPSEGATTGHVVQGREAVTLLRSVTAQAVASGDLQGQPAILVYTQESAPRVHVACLLAGASGVVHKSEPLDRLGEAIDVVASGGVVIDDRMANLIDVLVGQHRLDLTEAESSVLALTAHNWTRRRIARHLGSTDSTVDKHLRAIRDKFGDDVHLIELADSFGLRDLAPPEPHEPATYRQRLRDLLRGRDR